MRFKNKLLAKPSVSSTMQGEIFKYLTAFEPIATQAAILTFRNLKIRTYSAIRVAIGQEENKNT